MTVFALQFYEPKGEEYISTVRSRAAEGIKSYADLGRSFVSVKVEARGEYALFECIPNLPPVYWAFILLGGVAVFFGAPWYYAAICGGLALLVYSFWTPWVYILGVMLGFRKLYGRFPSLRKVSAVEVVRWFAGWKA